MRILVTGGTGHLGRDIVSLLTGQGHQVRVLARTPGQDPAVEWIQGDLATGRGITEAVSGTEVIVHAATFSPAARRGTIRPGDLVRSPQEVDIGGTRQLLGAAGQARRRAFPVRLDRGRQARSRAVLAAQGRRRGPGAPVQRAALDRAVDAVLLAARPDAGADGTPSGLPAAHEAADAAGGRGRLRGVRGRVRRGRAGRRPAAFRRTGHH
jgi:uncharacterized protein YbjT (DUF2867 family)